MDTQTDEVPRFRVIIAGGGIAGLTLAKALQIANVDFLLLESRDDIAPQVGASIGLGPNGMRILDQLGCLDDILAQTEPLAYAGNHYETGDYIVPKSDIWQLGGARSGYTATFVDRQVVLKALADSIQPNDNILLGKRISHVDHSATGIKVYCKDGSSYDGDILAGADGVNSIVRREMWRLADQATPGLITEEEKIAMSAEYQCLFGISAATEGLPLNSFDVTHMKNRCSLTITGKEGRAYFFIMKRLESVRHGTDMPRYSKAEAESFAEANLGINLTPKGAVKFKHVWRNRLSYALVIIEEARYEHWTWGRIACLGDGIHKVTPNAGAGGNMAMESAAVLANAIVAMTRQAKHPEMADVSRCLQDFQTKRQARADAGMIGANRLTRVHSLSTLKDRILAFYIMPAAGDALMDFVAHIQIGARRLEYVPAPPRSLLGTMPFNPEQGVTRDESKLRRMLWALPFLVVFVLSRYVMDASSLPTQATGFIKNGTVTWAAGSVPIKQSFYHVARLDDLVRPFTIFFAPSMYNWDSISWWQMTTFLTDVGAVYTIWLVEASRRASKLTFVQIPLVIGVIFQMFGIGPISSIYYFLHYISTPIYSFKALDDRLTDLSYTSTLLFTMISVYYLPHFSTYFAPALSARQSANWVWQLFPLWICLLQRSLRAAGLCLDTVAHDRIRAPLRDMKWIRGTVGCVGVASAAMYIYTVTCSPYSILQLFVPTTWSTGPDVLADQSLASVMRAFLQWDETFMVLNSFMWLGYMYGDLKAAGMLRESWAGIVGKGIGATVVLGPGAAIALGWLAREEILASRRHKGAVIAGRNDGVGLQRDGLDEKERVNGHGNGFAEEKQPKVDARMNRHA